MENYFRKRYENWAKFDIQRRKVIDEMVGFMNEACQYYVQRLGKKTIKLNKKVTLTFNSPLTDGTVYTEKDTPKVGDTQKVYVLISLSDLFLESISEGKNEELKIIAKKYDKR